MTWHKARASKVFAYEEIHLQRQTDRAKFLPVEKQAFGLPEELRPKQSSGYIHTSSINVIFFFLRKKKRKKYKKKNRKRFIIDIFHFFSFSFFFFFIEVLTHFKKNLLKKVEENDIPLLRKKPVELPAAGSKLLCDPKKEDKCIQWRNDELLR